MRALTAALASVLLTGCGAFSKDDDSSKGGGNSFSQPTGLGCAQGVVLDGITGKRIPLKQRNDAGDYQGVSVLVHNQLVEAAPMVSDGEGANAKLVGEYSLCGFPLDESFPVFAWVDGYEAFEGVISVASTIAQRTPNSRESDILRSHPTQLANIKLYPKGTETRDLKFIVSHGNNKKVAGAQVQLRATGKNVLDGEGALAPQIRLLPQTLATNSSGEVVFAAADLVLGGIYEYTILPPEGGDRLALAKGTVAVGLRSPDTALTERPYEVKVALGSSRLPAPTPTPTPPADGEDDGDDEGDGE